jgi:hypothetical protein
MKLSTEERTIVQDVVRTRTASIKMGSHVLKTLTDQYTNPRWALVREYITNAYDAYVTCPERAQTHPIQVHAPNAFEPWFEVQDFGVGMTYEQLWDRYTVFGESDKQADNLHTGGFGYGCKTAFAYRDGCPWVVTTVRDGIRAVLAAYRGSTGDPEYAELYHGPAAPGESNGTTVRVPIAPQDFRYVAQDIARICTYAPYPVKVTGEVVEVPTPYIKEAHLYVWADTEVREQPYIIMGGVPYPSGRYARASRADLILPVGTVSVTPNRDSVQVTPENEAAIRCGWEQALEELRGWFREREARSTRWELLRNCWPVEGTLRRMIGLSPEWSLTVKAEAVQDALALPELPILRVGPTLPKRWSQRPKPAPNMRRTPEIHRHPRQKGIVLLANTRDPVRASRAYLEQHMHEGEQHVYLIEPSPRKGVVVTNVHLQILKDLLQADEAHLTSTLTAHKERAQRPTITGRRIYKFYEYRWQQVVAKPFGTDKHYWLAMNNATPEDVRWTNSVLRHALRTYYKHAGSILGLPKALRQEVEIPTTFVPLDFSWLEVQLDQDLATAGDAIAVWGVEAFWRSQLKTDPFCRTLARLDPKRVTHPAVRALCILSRQFADPTNREKFWLAIALQRPVPPPPTVTTLKNLVTTVRKKFPLVEAVDDTVPVAHVLKYLNS